MPRAPRALGALAVLLPATAMWGFSVDDALISVRYAQHLRAGLGWCMRAGGPATDGVTPLPWPLVLAPLARGGALDVLFRARLLGLACGAATGAVVGAALARARVPGAAKVAALASLALSVPVGAWTGSGMETPLAMLLATLAATRAGAACAAWAGLAASLRPELLPWALTLAVLSPSVDGAARGARADALSPAGAGRADAPSPASAGRADAPRPAGAGAWPGSAEVARAAGRAVLAAGPFVACALVRLAAFGRVAPLAVLAKPSDLAHGGRYAAAAALASIAVPFACAPLALARTATPEVRRARALVAAGAAHLAAIAAAGGDWMPYARLVVPIAPSLAIAGALATTSRAALLPRALVTFALAAYVAAVAAPAGRAVVEDRAALVARAAPVLASARRVAAVDLGWVSAAAPAADLIDLAGVTDPEIAALPGGHTSKRVDGALLLARDPDVLVLAVPPRAVEAALRASPLVAERFVEVATIPLGTARAYTILARAPRASSPAAPP